MGGSRGVQPQDFLLQGAVWLLSAARGSESCWVPSCDRGHGLVTGGSATLVLRAL